jgi:hypothetical protein
MTVQVIPKFIPAVDLATSSVPRKGMKTNRDVKAILFRGICAFRAVQTAFRKTTKRNAMKIPKPTSPTFDRRNVARESDRWLP